MGQEPAGVLIVEDEFLVALDLDDIISAAGFRVVGIAADATGVETLSQEPRLALVDLNLRDGPTGSEIARWLASRFGTQIIFVTANPGQIDDPPRQAIGYVLKPFAADTIRSSVRFALENGDLERPSGLQPFS
jgi:two-component system, response regulator PdtaR